MFHVLFTCGKSGAPSQQGQLLCLAAHQLYVVLSHPSDSYAHKRDELLPGQGAPGMPKKGYNAFVLSSLSDCTTFFNGLCRR